MLDYHRSGRPICNIYIWPFHFREQVLVSKVIRKLPRNIFHRGEGWEKTLGENATDFICNRVFIGFWSAARTGTQVENGPSGSVQKQQNRPTSNYKARVTSRLLSLNKNQSEKTTVCSFYGGLCETGAGMKQLQRGGRRILFTFFPTGGYSCCLPVSSLYAKLRRVAASCSFIWPLVKG